MSDRPLRLCDVCGELDDHPRHVASVGKQGDGAVRGERLVELTEGRELPVAAILELANPRVTIDVQRFDSIPNDAVLIEAVWTVHRTAGGKTISGQTVAREAVQGGKQGDDYDALAAAHSRAVAKVAAEIASAIRTAAAGR